MSCSNRRRDVVFNNLCVLTWRAICVRPWGKEERNSENHKAWVEMKLVAAKEQPKVLTDEQRRRAAVDVGPWDAAHGGRATV